MTPSLPQTHTHPNPLTTLAPHLLPHLPHSLPLLRRIQFYASSPSSRTIATFPPSSSPPTSFTATWADRTRAPATECWIFSTYETSPLPNTSSQQQQQQEEEKKEAAKTQCLALLADIARSSPPAPTTTTTTTTTSVMVIGSLNERMLGIIGGEEAVGRLVPQNVVPRDIIPPPTTNSAGTGTIEGADKKKKRHVIVGLSKPYCKWLIGPVGKEMGASSSSSPGGLLRRRRRQREPEAVEEEEEAESSPATTTTLPPGYTFCDTLTLAEIQLTISRTAIPKTAEGLAQLGCVGVRYHQAHNLSSPSPSTSPSPFPSPSPSTKPTAQETNPSTDNTHNQSSLIAWSFLSHDGSLSTLHVEPLHRGQGLAKAISRRLLQRLANAADASGVGFRPVGVGVGDDDDDDGDAVKRGEYDGEIAGGYGKGEGWAHSDVAEGNVESAGVARGIGGVEGWRVRWVAVDLGAVGAEGEGATRLDGT